MYLNFEIEQELKSKGVDFIYFVVFQKEYSLEEP